MSDDPDIQPFQRLVDVYPTLDAKGRSVIRAHVDKRLKEAKTHNEAKRWLITKDALIYPIRTSRK